MRSIVPVIYHNGVPVEGALVIIEDVSGNKNSTTKADGTCEFVISDLRYSALHVRVDGYIDYDVSLILPQGNLQLWIGFVGEKNILHIELPELKSIIKVTNQLITSGINFIDKNGKKTFLRGLAQFNAFNLFHRGIDINSLINESIAFDFNLWRVFMQGSINQNRIFTLNPREDNYYEHVEEFYNIINGAGINLLPTVFVDNQDIKSDLNHWNRMCDIFSKYVGILSGGNQAPKNGFSPSSLNSSLPLWSRGSNLGDELPPKGGTILEFHTRRDYPKYMMDAVASPLAIYNEFNYPPIPLLITEPIGFNDNNELNRRSNDPDIANRLYTHYAKECAGAVFHNDYGMRGELMSTQVRECAEAAVAGMKS